jgi:stress response protein YsnF
MQRTLVAVFDSREHAEAARRQLAGAGVPDDRVDVRAGTLRDAVDPLLKSEAARGQRDEPGFLERLFGLDDEREHAGQYSEAMRRGSCLVVVDGVDDDHVEQLSRLLEQQGAIDIDARVQRWREQGWAGYQPDAAPLSEDEVAAERARYARTSDVSAGTPAPAEETSGRAAGDTERTRIPVVEEQLEVGKRRVEGGRVRVHTRVTERPVEENVTLREERARVERHAVDRPATEADLGAAFREETVELRESAEQAVVAKTTRVVEEVEIGLEGTERTETVRDTVRRSDVEVEDLPASRTGQTRDSGTVKRP